MFDILCRQKENLHVQPSRKNPLRTWPAQTPTNAKEANELRFDFEIEDFFCLGSPVGLFQMLKGR